MFTLAPRPLKSRRVAGFALLVALALAAWPDRADAQTYQPVNQVWAGDGYSLTIIDDGIDHFGGRRPIQVEFRRLTPAASTDTNLFFEYETSSRFNRLTTTESITLPGGQVAVKATVRVPTLGPTGGYGFRVHEDGVLLERLQQKAPPVYSYSLGAVAATTPRFLILGEPRPLEPSSAWLNLAATANSFDPNQYNGQQQVAPSPQEYPHLARQDWRAATTEWADYSGYDFIGVSREHLVAMAADHPKRFQAIKEWVGAGGNLIVGGCGADWEHLAEVEKAIGFSESSHSGRLPRAPWIMPKSNTSGLAIEAFRGNEQEWWGGPTPTPNSNSPGTDITSSELEFRLQQWLGLGRLPSLDPATKETLLEQFPSLRATNFEPRRPAERRFARRLVQSGMVIAVSTPNLLRPLDWTEADELPLTSDEWRWMFTEVGPKHAVWESRNGVTFIGDNSGHAGFRIPGVGQAPVWQFQVLITAFALLIGPLNFYWLRRRHRLHLMLITVPLCAGAATLGLLSYAIIADGFGTQARVRSVTLLDQTLGQAATWSRQAYYAGLTPSKGLKFPSDIVVMPVQDARETEDVSTPSLFRTLAWNEGRQDLTSGWLTGRKPTQLLTLRSRPSQAGVTITADPSVPKVLRGKNNLGTKIKQIYYRDAADSWRTASDVEPGAEFALQAAPASDAINLLTKQIQEQMWEQTEAPSYSGVLFRPRYYNRRKAVLAVDGLMEGTLQGLGDAARVSEFVRPGMYAAIVDDSPEVELGLEGVNDHDGFHLILGRHRAP